MDAAFWIEAYAVAGVGKPMPLILADKGYDVWMGNNRGTEYSRGNNLSLTTKDEKYWAFTYEEMGKYDDPANIKKIKEVTGKDKIFYMGYSQGTIQMFYGLIKLGKDMSDSLHKVVQLAPCMISG